eukprot:116606-Prorocentrum_minimum.AAC.1
MAASLPRRYRGSPCRTRRKSPRTPPARFCWQPPTPGPALARRPPLCPSSCGGSPPGQTPDPPTRS